MFKRLSNAISQIKVNRYSFQGFLLNIMPIKQSYITLSRRALDYGAAVKNRMLSMHNLYKILIT